MWPLFQRVKTTFYYNDNAQQEEITLRHNPLFAVSHFSGNCYWIVAAETGAMAKRSVAQVGRLYNKPAYPKSASLLEADAFTYQSAAAFTMGTFLSDTEFLGLVSAGTKWHKPSALLDEAKETARKGLSILFANAQGHARQRWRGLSLAVDDCIAGISSPSLPFVARRCKIAIPNESRP